MPCFFARDRKNVRELEVLERMTETFSASRGTTLVAIGELTDFCSTPGLRPSSRVRRSVQAFLLGAANKVVRDKSRPCSGCCHTYQRLQADDFSGRRSRSAADSGAQTHCCARSRAAASSFRMTESPAFAGIRLFVALAWVFSTSSSSASRNGFCKMTDDGEAQGPSPVFPLFPARACLMPLMSTMLALHLMFAEQPQAPQCRPIPASSDRAESKLYRECSVAGMSAASVVAHAFESQPCAAAQTNSPTSASSSMTRILPTIASSILPVPAGLQIPSIVPSLKWRIPLFPIPGRLLPLCV
jgi:hypothetical protein